MADPGGGLIGRGHRMLSFTKSLEDVAAGLQRGLSLWMPQPEAGEALIAANKLRVVYA
jgi:hypothetical protein